MNPDRVIGVDGRLPWHYPGDLRRFKRVTLGSTVVMGRKTFESMGSKPLPHRHNIVITRSSLDGVETSQSLNEALSQAKGNVWVIGGAQLYAEALPVVDVLDLTYVPDVDLGEGVVRFPAFDEREWFLGPRMRHEDEPTLWRQVGLRMVRAPLPTSRVVRRPM